MITRVFVDTEFTQFSDPMLISIGAVVDESRYFYGIVTDFPERACTQFVRDYVLPVLDAHPANVRGSHDRVAFSFIEWLQQLFEQEAEIVADDECDIELVKNLISRRMCRQEQLTLRFFSTSHGDGRPVIQKAIKEYFDADKKRRRHNALDDAFSYWIAVVSAEAALEDFRGNLSHR